MEKLKALLEYQKADIALFRLQREVFANPDAEKLEQAKKKFSNAKEAFSQSGKKAVDILKQFNSLKAEFLALEKKIALSQKDFDKIKEDDIQKQTVMLSEITKLLEQQKVIEKQIKFLQINSEKTKKEYDIAKQTGQSMRNIHAQIKDKIEKLENEKQPLIKKAKEEADKLKALVDGKLIEQYEMLKKSGKIPPVMEGLTSDSGKSFSCSGCGLSLGHDVKSALLEKKFSACENCKRMLYTSS